MQGRARLIKRTASLITGETSYPNQPKILIKLLQTRANPAHTRPAYLSWFGLETNQKLLKPDHEQGEAEIGVPIVNSESTTGEIGRHNQIGMPRLGIQICVLIF